MDKEFLTEHSINKELEWQNELLHLNANIFVHGLNYPLKWSIHAQYVVRFHFKLIQLN
jgi:hypothetical protein